MLEKSSSLEDTGEGTSSEGEENQLIVARKEAMRKTMMLMPSAQMTFVVPYLLESFDLLCKSLGRDSAQRMETANRIRTVWSQKYDVMPQFLWK